MYTSPQLEIQELFSQTDLAKAAIKFNVRSTLSQQNLDAIRQASWLAIATISEDSEPDVSIKAGSIGFIEVLSNTVLRFEHDIGNGMFITLGNLYKTSKSTPVDLPVALVVVSPVTGRKVRIKGSAVLSIQKGSKNLKAYVEVHIKTVWDNCPRYKKQIFDQLPLNRNPTLSILPYWKRLTILQPALSEAEKSFINKLGTITPTQWEDKVLSGTGDQEYEIKNDNQENQ